MFGASPCTGFRAGRPEQDANGLTLGLDFVKTLAELSLIKLLNDGCCVHARIIDRA
jgi:hypothetical protein